MRLRLRIVAIVAGLAGLVLHTGGSLRAQSSEGRPKIVVGMGKTFVLDYATDIEKIAFTAPEIAEGVPANMRTVMVNGKSPGETSAVVWLNDGTRIQYDVVVTFSATRLEAARQQLAQEFGDKVRITGDSSGVYLTGTVPDAFASQRAELIGESVGHVVNLLKAAVPRQEQEITLKIRFADVDRSKSMSLGVNIIGAPGGIPFNVTTGANSASRFSNANGSPPTFSLTDALNILMFDPHANIGATIQALEANSVLQILAEPNLTTLNGHMASFTAGGEFPFPSVQASGGVAQVSISFREYGIKLKFTPTITPRGTIRLHLAPEVSSLDYANSLTVSGSTIPAMSTKKFDTEVELQFGQSFAIESLSKIPGLSSIPVLGKLFQSKTISKANSELVVIVTPELVAPIPEGQALPDLEFPTKFIEGPGVMKTAPQNPGPEKTGPAPERPKRDEIPVQELQKYEQEQKALQNSTQMPTDTGTGGGGGTGASTGGGASAGAPAWVMPIAVAPTVPNQTQNNKGTGQ